jgi:hypothetical protein
MRKIVIDEMKKFLCGARAQNAESATRIVHQAGTMQDSSPAC